jgi:hypothetical protein
MKISTLLIQKPSFRIALLILVTCTLAQASFKVGQLFTGDRRGTVRVYDVNGNLVQTLDATLDDGNIPWVTGIAFDGAGNVYVSAWDPFDGVDGYSNVIKYDSSGNRIGTVTPGYFAFSGLIHDLAGNFYVGQIFGPILKFDVNGNILAFYSVAYVDGISLAPDQRTMAFTPDDPQLMNTGALDVVTDIQLPDIVVGHKGGVFLPDSTLADGSSPVTLWASDPLNPYPQSSYKLVKTYTPPSSGFIPDPDGATFWTMNAGVIYKMNIKTGQQVASVPAPLNGWLMAVYGYGMNSTSSFTPRLSFPNPRVGTMSAPLRATIKNTGQVEMVVTTPLISGDFKISKNQCAAGIRPGTHCDIYVVFAPKRTGLRLGTLTVTDNATNSPQRIALSGRGY